MADLLQPDICVVGGSSAGRSIAIAAAARGKQAIVVLPPEARPEALTARAALVEAGRRVQLVRGAASLGVVAEAVAVDFEMVRLHAQKALAAFAPNGAVERLAGLGVRAIMGEARFTAADTLAVEDRFEIKAKHVVIASGSLPDLPQIAGLEGTPYLTAETIADLPTCPEQLIVIGASATGLELAQAFRRFGAAVTVIDTGSALPDCDAECAAIVMRQLALEGISLRTGRKILSVKTGEAMGGSGTGSTGIEVTLDSPAGPEMLSGSHLLVAAGQRPAIDKLELDKAGVTLDGGCIAIDKGLRSANKKIHAIGDTAAGYPAAAAQHHAGLLIESLLLGRKVAARADIVPQVVLTDPELAQVGLDEAEARKRHKAIRLLRWPFAENERAVAEGDTTGHVRIMTNAAGRVLGATIVGRGASDQIAVFALAISQGAGIDALTKAVTPVPTRAEAGMRAASAFFVPGLTSPWMRRIMGSWRRSR